MGDARRKALVTRREAGQGQQALQVVDTLGGRMHVRWDEGAAATPHGQLVFFAEFLAATGVFERWVSSCPLSYRSGNAPDKRDVLGTLTLGLLGVTRHRLVATDGQGLAPATQPVVVAEGPAAAGRDDDVEAVASVADLVRPLAGRQVAQRGVRQTLSRLSTGRPAASPIHRGVHEISDPLPVAGSGYRHGV